MAEERHDAAFVVGAVVGGVAAGVYALFEAPQAGSQTRAQLRERGDAVAAQLGQATAEVDGRVRRWLVRADEQAAPLLRRVTGRRAARAVTREPVAGDRSSPSSPSSPSERGSAADTEPFTTLPDPPVPVPADETTVAAAVGPADDSTVDGPRVTNAPQ